ncbi:PTS mannose/fructose/sorbose/N-acetylgalactosamine transporter subunit IIC [Thermophilibacter sp.]|uniref:PTS mannose/fructose/sorbose/N-acetylgalactosamine transporter subunit IIC n=1 Tax=Thermophilibacter sp. TaxID=2847309 RepID=UPI003A9385C2
MSLTTALLVALWCTWGLIDEQTIQLQTTRPIITGPVVGLICGDLQTGLIVGATVELMFLATVFVGTATPPDTTLASGIATALACAAGGDTEIAVATALPVALIGQVVTTLQMTVVNVALLHIADRFTARGDVDSICKINKIALLFNFVFYGVPTFLAVYFGASYVQAIIDATPDWLISGLGVGGGMIGAVGLAVLLQSITNKKLWPYFVVGFVCAAFLGINMIGVGLVGVAAVFLHNYFTSARDEQPELGYEDEED